MPMESGAGCVSLGSSLGSEQLAQRRCVELWLSATESPDHDCEVGDSLALASKKHVVLNVGVRCLPVFLVVHRCHDHTRFWRDGRTADSSLRGFHFASDSSDRHRSSSSHSQAGIATIRHDCS